MLADCRRYSGTNEPSAGREPESIARMDLPIRPVGLLSISSTTRGAMPLV